MKALLGNFEIFLDLKKRKYIVKDKLIDEKYEFSSIQEVNDFISDEIKIENDLHTLSANQVLLGFRSGLEITDY